ncbi:MAG: hypothetical protein II621_08380, partial [Clostridia bacterium]|nr:hypothetical protein [Clostridia bacterium]
RIRSSGWRIKRPDRQAKRPSGGGQAVRHKKRKQTEEAYPSVCRFFCRLFRKIAQKTAALNPLISARQIVDK